MTRHRINFKGDSDRSGYRALQLDAGLHIVGSIDELYRIKHPKKKRKGREVKLPSFSFQKDESKGD